MVMGPTLFLVALLLYGQEPDLTTVSGSARALQADARDTVIAAAVLMKPEDYGFAPVGGVRTFGQLVGHVADTQYLFCAAAMGEPNPKPQAPIEKSQGGKADLVAALKDAFAYCDKVFDGTTDANATAVVTFLGARRSRLNVLTINTIHTFDHYGNMVTYLRMKGLVPPTSTPAAPPTPKVPLKK